MLLPSWEMSCASRASMPPVASILLVVREWFGREVREADGFVLESLVLWISHPSPILPMLWSVCSFSITKLKLLVGFFHYIFV